MIDAITRSSRERDSNSRMRIAGFALLGLAAVIASPRRYRLAIWIAVVAAIVVPWRTFQTHSHPDAILLIPLVSPPVRLHDIIGNIVLYIPFGFFYASRVGDRLARAQILRGVGWAALLAVLTEASQIYSHGRFPSVQDALANVLGAGLGIAIASRVLQKRHPSGNKNPSPPKQARFC
jgi:VanZ family protein